MTDTVRPSPVAQNDAMGGPARHPLHWDGPQPRFLDGALLGNGGLGLVVTTRPDAVVLHLGHNGVWDERVDEGHAPHIGTFAEAFDRVDAIDPTLASLDEDPWFAEYRATMEQPYDSNPYPRPYPCGSIVLGIDRRSTVIRGHRLDISTGTCTIDLVHHGRLRKVRIDVDQSVDSVWISSEADPDDTTSPFRRVHLVPDVLGPISEPSRRSPALVAVQATIDGTLQLRNGISAHQGEHEIGFTEVLPTFGGTAPYYSVAVTTSAVLMDGDRAAWDGSRRPLGPLERAIGTEQSLVAVVRLSHGHVESENAPPVPLFDEVEREREALAQSALIWADYWAKSSIRLSDVELESVWYHNTYFAHCALRAGEPCPGIFGNWSLGEVGSAWHGDYHLNYNTQQTFWGVFSSNRVESHLPYVDLVENLLPLSKAWAKNFYGLEGAYFPHSAYPVPMTTMPYPSPLWGWEVCETPWTVQSLWWHFEFTRDLDFLRERAFAPIEQAVTFLVGYITRPEARGERWGDEYWHIFPTVVPELYGLRPGFAFNSDCLVDIALTKFVFRAYERACDILGVDRAEMLERVRSVLEHLPGYATASTADGEVFVAVEGEHPDTVYNVPVPGMTVFPGEDHSWESDDATLDIARRSVMRQSNEGGNEVVMMHLQMARLGILDLERFKRALSYCRLGNGTYTDMVTQVNGRYSDALPFDFMAGMGVWVENFALTAVLNECLLQASSGTVRLFPNCTGLDSASFSTLRAPGAFLVSAAMTARVVDRVDILSEAGEPLRILVPWDDGASCVRGDGSVEQLAPGIVTIPTIPGESLRLISIARRGSHEVPRPPRRA